MKHAITDNERKIFDKCAVAAAQLEQTRRELAASRDRFVKIVETLLEIDEWDHQKRDQIATYIVEGAPVCSDRFLSLLGITLRG